MPKVGQFERNYETRDDIEIAQVHDALASLPQDHVARAALAAGADTIALTHLVGDSDIADQLKDAWLAGYRRMLGRAGGHFRP